jgi:asparagine synthase (glutamine-hydrolysing)
MCGLVGVFRRARERAVEPQLLRQMNAAIAHRGPDDDGVYIDGGLGLAHRRLSVIDLTPGGHQPMIDRERERVIVYNGEIFNYREVRQRAFGAAGAAITTNSDTEVLLKLAEFDRLDWLEELNGMFTFALWDARSRRLMLARDRLGVKPLYYVDLGDELLFASEIKALLVHPRVRREINLERIPEFLAFRTVSGPETLFKGIRQLPPGHVLITSQERFEPRIVEFWSEGRGRELRDYVDASASYEDQLESLLREAVRSRLVSDVPVGSFNSGGVDSSLVSAIMRSMTEGELHTFSVGFEEPDYDERRYAQRVADKLGTRHHTLVVNEHQFADRLEHTLLHLEEPLNHANTVQLQMLSELARRYVTVVLTGEGSDEVFGGYPRLQLPLLARYVSLLPQPLARGLQHLARALGQRRLVKVFESRDVRQSALENARTLPQEDFAALVPQQAHFPNRERILDGAQERRATLLAAMLYFEQRTYLPSLLMRLDKASMASALECRVPFLDYRLVEWSYLIPDRYKLRLATANKFLVKKVAERWLPRDIVYRPKSGFGNPLAKWLRNPAGLGRYVDLLTDETANTRGLFDRRGVERLVREHLDGAADHSEALWGMMSLEMWCRAFIDRSPAAMRRDAAAAQAGVA